MSLAAIRLPQNVPVVWQADCREVLGARRRERRERRWYKNPTRYRLQALALGGAIMGLGGTVHAHFIGFIAPDNYQSPDVSAGRC